MTNSIGQRMLRVTSNYQTMMTLLLKRSNRRIPIKILKLLICCLTRAVFRRYCNGNYNFVFHDLNYFVSQDEHELRKLALESALQHQLESGGSDFEGEI